ncbi:MAG: hypothetical protein HN348_32550, partial [Proteobacteria bacterium]|nr:hypothetical protein [Pseudomonadota bacterium]
MYRWVGEGIGVGPRHAYYDLLPYGYWGLASILVRILVPILIIVFIYREPIANYGFRLSGGAKHTWVYVSFYLIMVPLVVAVSFLPGFQRQYPFYDDAVLGWAFFIPYTLLYGIQFFGVEAFFRGWVLFALARRLGFHAIGVMMIPYMMIHFGKPPLETLGATVAGVSLGFLALKS